MATTVSWGALEGCQGWQGARTPSSGNMQIRWRCASCATRTVPRGKWRNLSQPHKYRNTQIQTRASHFLFKKMKCLSKKIDVEVIERTRVHTCFMCLQMHRSWSERLSVYRVSNWLLSWTVTYNGTVQIVFKLRNTKFTKLMKIFIICMSFYFLLCIVWLPPVSHAVTLAYRWSRLEWWVGCLPSSSWACLSSCCYDDATSRRRGPCEDSSRRERWEAETELLSHKGLLGLEFNQLSASKWTESKPSISASTVSWTADPQWWGAQPGSAPYPEGDRV